MNAEESKKQSPEQAHQELPSEEQTVDSPERRKAIAAVLGGASAAYLAGMGYVAYRYLTTGIENPDAAVQGKIKVDGAQEMAANSSKTVKYGSKPVIIIKDKAGKYVAMSAVCTHLGCNVSYQADQTRIFCACHGGVYDPSNGKNVSGPPPAPLKLYKITQEEDGVYIDKA